MDQSLDIRSRYARVRKLASGGMAEIFLATQQGADGVARPVVVKRLLRHLAEDERFVQMFVDEANLGLKLDHPNIVRTFELVAEPERQNFLIAMEYLDGCDLVALRRAASPARRAGSGRGRSVQGRGLVQHHRVWARIMADVAAGLHHAHELRDELGFPLNVVHRDVSLGNVVMTRSGRAKLVDFGVAKAECINDRTAIGEVKGKIDYMAPEQVTGMMVDRRTDVWAIGVCLYRLCAGARPFRAEHTAALIHQILYEAPRPLEELVPGCSPQLARIIERALSKHPSDRQPSAAALADDIEAWLAAQGRVGEREVAAFMQGFLPRVLSPRTTAPDLAAEPAAAPASARMSGDGAGGPDAADHGAEAPLDLLAAFGAPEVSGDEPLTTATEALVPRLDARSTSAADGGRAAGPDGARAVALAGPPGGGLLEATFAEPAPALDTHDFRVDDLLTTDLETSAQLRRPVLADAPARFCAYIAEVVPFAAALRYTVAAHPALAFGLYLFAMTFALSVRGATPGQWLFGFELVTIGRWGSFARRNRSAFTAGTNAWASSAPGAPRALAAPGTASWTSANRARPDLAPPGTAGWTSSAGRDRAGTNAGSKDWMGPVQARVAAPLAAGPGLAAPGTAVRATLPRGLLRFVLQQGWLLLLSYALHGAAPDLELGRRAPLTAAPLFDAALCWGCISLLGALSLLFGRRALHDRLAGVTVVNSPED